MSGSAQLRETNFLLILVFAARDVDRYQSSKTGDSQEGNPLLKYLTMKIKATGPITVAEYMREVLTNPLKGYYMHQNMLGEHGDFVTSPEISQIFGELIGIWCINEWISGGKSKSLNLVEFGPGRGSLMDDILRVFSQFQNLLNTCDISIHLVEVSPKLSEIQALNLTGKSTMAKHEDKPSYKTGITKTGLPINWYYNIEDVPSGYTFYIAHEFFDALPIHKLQKIQDKWKEILVDVDPENPQKLRFVLGSGCSLIARTFVQPDENRNHVEVCPEAAVIIQKLVSQLKIYGGAALIADYGHSGDKEDTFRGFRSHQLHNVLLDPGTADLTADVDFNFLKNMTANKVSFLGPITQHEFLRNMGIDFRLKVLMENAKDAATQQHLIASYDVLMNPNKMGKRFHFFSLFPHSRLEQASKLKYPIAGFTKLEMS
ncbi:PREDICTED: NADH dehydrogenase [ubiquinone] complex I, assembly factor 7 [Nanorana parkeri]|uniref:NADH dehydrogenase [ubiquinone] complex I, assembly factor 7 n=1 Tax=Nanorana parkeri TaxID=125878 RepID=UPI000854BDDA|nr:PREDICTED: NADH dehydrogenase [ubiquinone] complex I, assembly factor 7 [Nanorana parkeri]